MVAYAAGQIKFSIALQKRLGSPRKKARIEIGLLHDLRAMGAPFIVINQLDGGGDIIIDRLGAQFRRQTHAREQRGIGMSVRLFAIEANTG